MSKTVKLLLGIATLWPVAYMLLFFSFIVSAILFNSAEPVEGGGAPPAFAVLFVLHLLTMLVITALTVFYIVNVFRNNRVEKDKKALWAIVLFLGNIIAMPIYWYMYIWKAEPELPTFTMPGQLGGASSTAWTNNVKTSRAAQEQYVPPSQPPDWR